MKSAFNIVAVATSAGGLHALTNILTTLPADFPVPVVVVQHLDPRHRSLMAEILGRVTALTIRQAQEGDRLAPGTVYIAPLTGISWSIRTEPCRFRNPNWSTSYDRRPTSCLNRSRRVIENALSR